ncbi:MAG: DMT family transporter [Alphaproteobacteria bacterium]|nr:DMT family transporter [Alphaproteobacteria bacterium]
MPLVDALPVLLALVAAFLFALGAQFQSVGLLSIEPRSGAVITITTSAVLFLLAAPFLLDPAHLLHPAVLTFVLVGLFRPALSANLALAGMKYLGPTLAITLTSTSPLFGAALGILWLGEVLTWQTGVGTLAIVAAVMVLSGRRGGAAVSWPVWALLLPIGAALVRSAGHVLSKYGMEWIPDPYIASMVGFVVSAVVTQTAHRVRRSAPAIPWRSRPALWFMGASVCFGVAIMALNTALLIGTVVQVVPVVAASPVFTLFMSVIAFRQERITPRILLAVAMVTPAVILIGLAD